MDKSNHHLQTIKEKLCVATYKRHSYRDYRPLIVRDDKFERHVYGICERCHRVMIMSEPDFRLYLKELYGN